MVDLHTQYLEQAHLDVRLTTLGNHGLYWTDFFFLTEAPGGRMTKVHTDYDYDNFRKYALRGRFLPVLRKCPGLSLVCLVAGYPIQRQVSNAVELMPKLVEKLRLSRQWWFAHDNGQFCIAFPNDADAMLFDEFVNIYEMINMHFSSVRNVLKRPLV